MSLPRTQEALERIVDAIARNHGDIGLAARELGTQAAYIHIWMQSDPEAAQQIKTAQLIGYSSIETAAIQRAVHGVEKAVYYKGDVVGYETNYSDGLMNTVLKARVPGYNPDQMHVHQHMVNVNLMPRASNYEEWQEQRQTALQAPQSTEPALEAEYTEVRESRDTGDSGAEGLRDVL